MFSKACEYAIKAAIFVALKSEQNKRVTINEIASEINSPLSFTAKIMQKLVKNKLIDSLKGPTGGFEIKNDKAAKIMLSQIVKAIDGDLFYEACALGFHKCNELEPCSLHFKFKTIRSEFGMMLENTSLMELSEDINKGIAFLKRKKDRVA